MRRRHLDRRAATDHGPSCCAGSRGCDGLLTLLTDRVDDELLDAAGPRLKVVSNFAVGYDNIDVAACARRGIPVGNTPGVLTETTADLAWALHARGRCAACPRATATSAPATGGRGARCCCSGGDVHGATLGIVGFGRIGQAVARRAQGFGMRVLYTLADAARRRTSRRRSGRARATSTTCSRPSDFVSLHVPADRRRRAA